MKHIWIIFISFIILFLSATQVSACITMPGPWYKMTLQIDSSNTPPENPFILKNPYADKDIHPYMFQNNSDVLLYVLVAANSSYPKKSHELPQGFIPLYKLTNDQIFYNTDNHDGWLDQTDSGALVGDQTIKFNRGYDGKVYQGVGTDILGELGINVDNKFGEKTPLVIPPHEPQKIRISLLYKGKVYDVTGTVFFTPNYFYQIKSVKDSVINILNFSLIIFVFFNLIKLAKNKKDLITRKKILFKTAVSVAILIAVFLYRISTLSLSC